MDAVAAKGAHQVHCEERKPAEDEPADDDAQCLRRLRLHSKSLHLSFNISLPHLHHSWLLLGDLSELPQRHLITHHLTLAAVPPARSSGASNPVDAAHL